ncbi:hypothetical protein NPIL_123501, partial [Nephila pilipes]
MRCSWDVIEYGLRETKCETWLGSHRVRNERVRGREA